MARITPDSPVDVLFGRSYTKRKKTKDMGLETVGDLLDHFPRRYIETGVLSEGTELVEGEQVTVVGRIRDQKDGRFENRANGRLSYRVTMVVETAGPRVSVTKFTTHRGQFDGWKDLYAAGGVGMFFGKTRRFGDTWQLDNAEVHMLDRGDDGLAQSMSGLVPVYRVTSGLQTWDLQKVVQAALDLVDDVPELLPASLRERHDLLDVMHAYRLVHGPDDYGQVTRGRRRFAFEEALLLQLVLVRRRAAQRALGGSARTGGGGLLAAFDARLPFELTGAQRQVGAEIEADLARPHAMNRLLQGEVGSGKTLVALRAMLRVVDSGGQAALLAPTEVLAQQHHRSITAMLGDLAQGGLLGGADDATTVALLTGSASTASRRQAMLDIASGEAGIVVGTHALLEDKVSFADLGLVVVDEQHRFGVEQRAALASKSETPPHVLVMTATPIPRTVAMTVFGDLETSVIAELPAGRAPIQTTVVPLAEQPAWIDRVWQRVREEVEKGHQVYVVCPRISGDEIEEGGSDQLDLEVDGARPAPPRGAQRAPAAVDEVVEELRHGPLAGLRVSPLHGRMSPDDKDATMRAFAAGEVDVLVATTVIEVGVDVHNATAMVLLDADRFGVSQLHQLRGRVGRGGLPGLCLLVTHAAHDTPARERLAAVAATTDGFELSRVDLEQRREGDVLGAAQSGYRSSLRALRVLRDEKTILEARAAAEELLTDDPDLAAHPHLAAAVAGLEARRESDFIERS